MELSHMTILPLFTSLRHHQHSFLDDPDGPYAINKPERPLGRRIARVIWIQAFLSSTVFETRSKPLMTPFMVPSYDIPFMVPSYDHPFMVPCEMGVSSARGFLIHALCGFLEHQPTRPPCTRLRYVDFGSIIRPARHTYASLWLPTCQKYYR